jgi:hypothetical protein
VEAELLRPVVVLALCESRTQHQQGSKQASRSAAFCTACKQGRQLFLSTSLLILLLWACWAADILVFATLQSSAKGLARVLPH